MDKILFELQRFADIFNMADNSLVSGTSGDDFISSQGDNVTINGNGGNDYLSNDRGGGGSYVAINGGEGNDIINGGWVDKALLKGDNGNDSIVGGTKNYTLDGGNGNDTLHSGAEYSLFIGGDGNDRIDTYMGIIQNANTIYGGVGNDTLIDNDGMSKSYVDGGTGNDYINVTHSNYTTVLGGAGKDTIMTAGVGKNNYISGGAGDDIMEIFSRNDTIIGGAGNDFIVLERYGTEIIQFGSGDGKDIVTGFNSDDTLQITSGNINSSVVSNNNLTLKVGDGKITLSDVGGTTIKIKLASGNLISLAVPGGSSGGSETDDGGEESSDDGGGDGNMEGITVTNGTVYVGSDFEGDTIDLADYPSNVSKVYAATYSGDLEILGTSKNNSLVGGKGDDLISGGAGKDTLTGGKGEDIFIHTEGKDVITDYTAGEDKIQLENGIDDISNSKFSGKNLIFTTETGSITVKGGKGKKITFVDSQGNEEIWGASDTLPKGLTYNANKAMLTAAKNFTGDKIDVSDYSQTTNAKIINAKAVTNNVEIVGNSLNNSIVGGKGDDTLFGGKGTDTLVGGNGSDIFMHTGGSDVIKDYTVGEDIIHLGDGIEITKAKLNVKDIILTTSVGTITIKDGKNKKITVMDSEGDETTKIYPVTKMTGLSYSNNKTVLTVKKSFAGETIELDDYASTVKTVNAKAATVKVDIIGNKLNNSLVGGKGDDTLAGGAGKDTLTGGKGEDVFVYTKGNDVITDYKQGEDKIQLDDGVKIKSWKISGSNVVFTTSSGNFTVKDGKNKKITIVDANDKETTKTYGKSTSSNVSDLWFAEENNFAISDNLSAITKNDLTPSSLEKISTTDYEKLQTENNLVTFSEK